MCLATVQCLYTHHTHTRTLCTQRMYRRKNWGTKKNGEQLVCSPPHSVFKSPTPNTASSDQDYTTRRFERITHRDVSTDATLQHTHTHTHTHTEREREREREREPGCSVHVGGPIVVAGHASPHSLLAHHGLQEILSSECALEDLLLHSLKIALFRIIYVHMYICMCVCVCV
jgi:hypothetical protein